jgi:hypothetical protein
MSETLVMGSLSATVDFREFDRVLTQYAANSKLTVEQAVAKKFRSVVFEARKLQLATRPETLAKIQAQAPHGLRFSKWTLQRMNKRINKQRSTLESANKAKRLNGKRVEKALLRIVKASAELQRLQQNWQQIGWEMEKKQRENAAGRAGAWGWLIKGNQFQDIVSAHRSAKVSKSSDIFRTFLEIINNRPDSAQFADSKGIISRAMSNVLADMKTYIQRQLSKL